MSNMLTPFLKKSPLLKEGIYLPSVCVRVCVCVCVCVCACKNNIFKELKTLHAENTLICAFNAEAVVT